MHLDIITPEKKLYSGEIRLVSLPGSKGAFEILNNHAPIVSTLEAGVVRVVDIKGIESEYRIKNGVVECLHNQVSVLVESE